MLHKLTLRNAARSTKDYLIYIGTMAFISAMMFAFHSMMFSEDMKAVYHEMTIFIALVSVASFFIVIIVIWLVHYMVRFMTEKRSREFGTYLLLGMKKKQIAGIFRKENIMLGLIALILGILPGFLLQKLFTNVFYSILDTEYHITPEINWTGLLITTGVITLSYLLALINVRFTFKKMQIRDLIYMDRRNEEMRYEKKTWKKILVLIAVLYIIFFNILVFRSLMDSLTVWLYIAGLIAAIYMLFIGLSSFFVHFIKQKKEIVYKEANLFILRLLSSKIKTMCFTMGTLSILFTAALLGWMAVMMFGDYQQKEMTRQLPFGVLVFSDQNDYDFRKELEVISDHVPIEESHIYRIYQNGTAVVNNYLYEHRSGTYRSALMIDDRMGDSTYFEYDTYMGLSDYNRIRSMIHLEPVDLEQGHYILHGKTLIDQELLQIPELLDIQAGSKMLSCQEIRTEPLSQEGMNGADYVIIVPDALINDLTPYYSLLAADLDGQPPAELQQWLLDLQDYYSEEHYENLYDIGVGRGSSQVLSWADTVLVSDNVIKEGSYIITVLCFVLAYIGMVFLCTALTILAVQQLSDSAKYQFRYLILRQLGISHRGIHKIVLKQLAAYYLCPLTVSILLSMFIGLFASERFVYYTGIHALRFQYYLLGVLVFLILYAIYFIISYTGFMRNLKIDS